MLVSDEGDGAAGLVAALPGVVSLAGGGAVDGGASAGASGLGASAASLLVVPPSSGDALVVVGRAVDCPSF